MTCQAVRNGACLPAESFFERNKIRSDQIYPLVISLATSWRGTWHFPMENIVALAHIDRAVLVKAYFHLPLKNEYITSWLSALGVPVNRLLNSTVACDVLLAPEMRCAKPFFSQLEWMRQAYLPEETLQQRKAVCFNYNLNISTSQPDANTEDRPLSPEGTTTPATTANTTSALTVLLIERNQNRGVNNMNTVHALVQAYAREHNMKFLFHSDRSLPSLPEQMRRFAQADVVLAPHGAGLIFTAFLPYTSCIVEFSHASNPLYYAHIAYARNLSYIMYDMVDNTMDESLVKTGLERCIEAVTISKQQYSTPVVTSSAGSVSSNVGSTNILTAVTEGINNIIKSDSVVQGVLTTLSNFVP